MVDADPELLSNLMEWRTDQLERPGITDEQLPAAFDLELVASVPGITRERLLDGLPLTNADAMRTFAAGVMGVVKAYQRERAARPAPAPAAPPAAPEEKTPPAARPSKRTPRPAPVDSPAQPVAAAPPTQPATQPATQPPTQSPTTPATTRAAAPAAATSAAPPFTPFDYATFVRPPMVGPLLFKPQPDGRLWIGWTPSTDAATVVYRVVQRDGHPPSSPDAAEEIGVTTDTQLYTSGGADSVRFVQVWAYSGADEAAARSSQPRLLGQGMVVAPPVSVDCREADGSVVVAWELAPGVHGVEIARLALDTRDAQVESLHRAEGPGSFHDTTCLPGRRYEYQVAAVAEDPETRADQLSEPVRREQRITSALVKVQQLRATERLENGRTYVDLEWDRPGSDDVRIYRSVAPPAVGSGDKILDISALESTGLKDADRQILPVESDDRVSRMAGIAWPDTQPRIHLTAVSISGDQALIGTTETRSRTTEITEVRLVQRVQQQLLSFSWPPGTASVDVHVTPVGMPLESDSRPIRSVSESDYRRDGGTLIELPWNGCDVHLVPISWYGRDKDYGPTTSISYAGLLTLQYGLRPRQSATDGTPGASGYELAVHRVSDGPSGPASLDVTLSLVVKAGRLPLSVRDGDGAVWTERITVETLNPARWVPLPGVVDLSAHSGKYVRLFARLDAATEMDIALLDPAVVDLRVP